MFTKKEHTAMTFYHNPEVNLKATLEKWKSIGSKQAKR